MPPRSSTHVFGGPARDLLAITALLVLLVLAVPSVLVYYRGVSFRVAGWEVSADGHRTELENIGDVQRSHAYDVPTEFLNRISGSIDDFVDENALLAEAPPGTRFEWEVRYSTNSFDHDEVARFTTTPEGTSQR